MNHEHLEDSTVRFPTYDRVLETQPDIDQRHSPSQKGPHLSSTPSDADWVSPFTLPPLPALHRNRGQSSRLTSPEHLRSRAESGAYYAAAWGSPYATPSPGRSSGPTRLMRKSFDHDSSSSPLQYRNSGLSSSAKLSRHSTDFGGLISRDSGYENRWKTLRRAKSERSNWLSDSESGGEGRSSKEVGNTPTRGKAGPDQDRNTPGSARSSDRTPHQVNESISTITPIRFRGANVTKVEPVALVQNSSSNSGYSPAMESENISAGADSSSEKPLPNLPQSTLLNHETKTVEDTASPTRPQPNSLQSFQRPKKKVTWKGKACIIAMPLTSREEAGLPPLLTPEEIRAGLENWISAGYSINGFELDDPFHNKSIRGSGQSRSSFPDPTDMHTEYQKRLFTVHIPDQAEWDSWVDYLQEEKLRALGVTSSSSEAPPSSRSPFSASLSRSSSRYAGLSASPPVAPSSSASNPLHAKARPFSPSYNTLAAKSPQNGSIMSSQYNGTTGAMHGYKTSMTPAMLQPRMTSPYDYPISQPSSLGPGVRSPAQSNMSSTNFPPMQSLGEVLSPISPISGGENGTFTYPNALIDNVRRHQQELQAHMARQQHNHQSQKSLVTGDQNSDVHRQMLTSDASSRPPLEIAHPTPRSHRHNLSMALQKEIDEADAASERAIRADGKSDQVEETTKPLDLDREPAEDPLNDDLPILKRPETISRTGDKSEVETNPSIAGSPMLIDDKNSLRNWQALSEAAKGGTEASNKSKRSVSKFNVAAKEFDPQAGFSSSNFTFGQGTVHAFSLPQLSASDFDFKLGSNQKQSQPRLNVEAPAFTPGNLNNALQGSISKFSSPTFNVEAPEFNPARYSATNFRSNVNVEFKDPSSTSTSLFGEVYIDPESKTSRRSNKAVTVTRPRSRETSPNTDGSIVDEDDRPTLPSERLKRARRVGDDGNNSPVFAENAPFGHRRILSEIIDDVEVHGTRNEDISEKPVDGWAYIPAEARTTADQGVSEPNRSTHSSDSDVRGSPPVKEEGINTGNPVEARPHSEIEVTKTSDNSVSDLEQEVKLNVESPPRPSEPTDTIDESSNKTRTSLSALAKPFEFKATRHSSVSPDASLEPRKTSGLFASRFARSPSPPVQIAKSSSPEAGLYQYIKAEDEPSIEEARTAETSPLKQLLDDDEQQRPRAYSEASSEDEDVERLMSEPEADRTLVLNHEEEAVPSFEEIDAVMKQFETNPDLGVERNDMPIQCTPPLDMRLPPNLRSDAPSPSPRRAQPMAEPESGPSSNAAFGLGINVRKITSGKEEVSDWNDELSSTEEDKLLNRSRFFDGHVDRIVGGILDHRLAPLEKSLQIIQHSLTRQTRSKNGRRSTSTEVKESDADDEDDYDAYEGFSVYRSRSPMAKRERKPDRIRGMIAEALVAYQQQNLGQSSLDLSEIQTTLAELKHIAEQAPRRESQADLRSVVDDAISHHPRLRGSRVQQDHESGETRYKLQIDGLESMLRIANERAEEEARLRRQSDDVVADLKFKLKIAEEEVSEHRESSETAQQSLLAFIEEKNAFNSLETDLEELQLKNAALETTLEEYRVSSDQWRDDIREERSKTTALTRTLRDLGDQLEDSTQCRRALRAKVERLQDQITNVVQDVTTEQSEWRTREHELLSKTSLLQSSWEHEIRHREKVEMELAAMSQRYHETSHFKSSLDMTQGEISRLQQMVASLTDEKMSHQSEATRIQRELTDANANTDNQISLATVRLQAELEGANVYSESLRSDYEAQITRLKRRLDDTEMDLEVQKTKHDGLLAETIDAHQQAIREANEKREVALEEQHAAHERKLNDLRDRHTRALHNSSDDKHRLEHHLTEKLALSQDKIEHLEGKLTDIEERLDITKSAARAAVEAATTRGANLPTPAPSVVASPPQRSTSASLAFTKGSEIPEKISPQALRESILVLQEQLQNREQQIEKFETELATIDKDASNKLRERETEVTWLRELLGVRIDDLEEIIATLAQPTFNREATKDAAIRLRANLQMEQQLRERGPAGLISSLPSLAALSSYAQSPRALPMAAAAAWGSWLKAKDTSMGALSDLATNLGSQTPSKSTIGSPANFLSGMMTPPSTMQRTPTPTDPSTPSTTRPLAGATAARKGGNIPEARPLRAYNKQPRSLASHRQQQENRPGSSGSTSYASSNQTITTPDLQSYPPPIHSSSTYRRPESSPPHTPTSSRPSLDLADDVDEDASPLDGRQS